MKYGYLKSLLLEDSDVIELIYKDFNELLPHKPRLSIVEFSNDFKPRLKIASQTDPSLAGYVEYADGIDVRKAYLALVNGKDLLTYMKRHMDNVYTALSWYLIVNETEANESNAETDHEKSAEDLTQNEEDIEMPETPVAGTPEESPETEETEETPANVKVETEPIPAG